MGGLETLQNATLFEQIGLGAVLLTSIAALIYAWMLAREVLREDPGTLRNLLPGRAPDALRMRRELEAKYRVASLDDLRETRRRRIEELKALGYL